MWVRVVGFAEMLLSIPLFALGVLVLGGIPVNGLIILGNAGASYLLGRHTYSKGLSIGSTLLNLGHLLIVMLMSYILCRVIASAS